MKVGQPLLDLLPQFTLQAQAVALLLQLGDGLTADFQKGVNDLVKVNARNQPRKANRWCRHCASPPFSTRIGRRPRKTALRQEKGPSGGGVTAARHGRGGYGVGLLGR
ncbi:hypothetical protein HRbin17_01506 [bacterium HR17]|uniref:Uncharacterized protein n=1 Tax=Candidatus Fervidibacter japonicus TaxID=2035412 RepID=A0A2H5XCU5_9BACT|nr:hypothetical protein HRbin17_01506 [bacterium HR17]